MQPTDDIELIDDSAYYRITPLDGIEPFLMTIVSNADLWMFVSSAGGLTAGRVEPANCVFPYESDDRLHHVGGRVGPATVVRVRRGDDGIVWRPFVGGCEGRQRSVSKSLLGNAVVFEEQHPGLGLTFRYRWAPSDRYGWVRTATLVHHEGHEPATIDVVDGFLGVMPWGIDVGMQQSMSNLANAYRRSEVVEPGLGVFTIEALIVDRPEPAEALRATTVWSTGLPGARHGVDPRALDAVASGAPFAQSTLLTGRPGSFLVAATIESAPGTTHRWHTAIDGAQSHADIVRIAHELRTSEDLSKAVDDDIDRCSAGLVDIIASADGVQSTGSATIDAHHTANTLFNVMRGGTFPNGYSIDGRAFRSFVASRNAATAQRHAAWFADLPEVIDVADLRARASRPGDADLTRLAHEYLPLAFSRRHGDPSRPWNHFAIHVRDADGDPVLSYQGNWRDIFQNWEALCRSYPNFLPSIIAKFVNASTGDGFNPYRITSDGIDWEVPEPDQPWSGIGYWGDHQIVYLYRLLLSLHRHDPSRLRAELGRRVYSFADVPYRIVPFDRLRLDPKSSVVFDRQADERTVRRVGEIGTDGRLVLDVNGGVAHVALLEKLLIPALAKLSNYVPRGGVWMNTQRPEWNDANNALVGYGLSMVTLAHLRRYLQLISELTSDLSESILVSADVIDWATRVTEILEAHEVMVGSPTIDDAARGRLVQELGETFGRYRERFYAAGPSPSRPFPAAVLRRLLRTAQRHLDDSLRAARRPDGLYDAYNLLSFADDGAVGVERLPVMLEGQVAAIGSGLLDATEVSELVETMYRSELYRPDVDTFVLYPATVRPSFVARNNVSEDDVDANPLLRAMVLAGDQQIIERDLDGVHHFAPAFKSGYELRAVLDRLADGEYAELVAAHRGQVLDLYERVFEHHRFTGRSATMYAYEGIGSVYWHMVAKLLVAVQEVILDADADTDPASLAELTTWYDRIRSGLGFNKTASEFGAFPTDPYSHTPAHAGAQQPGMTGQVKEELLTRWAELGLTVGGGRLRFSPRLLSGAEFRSEPGELEYLDVAGRRCRIELPIGAAAFTVCRVPVVVCGIDDEARIVVTDQCGGQRVVPGWELDRAASEDVFDHGGKVARLDVFVPRETMCR
jgi:hypothetical protein